MFNLDEDDREHMRSVLGWVEGERKGHFPDIVDSAQIQYCITASFCWIHALVLYLDAGRHNARHYVLMIRMLTSCSRLTVCVSRCSPSYPPS
jgi:hypothetical protein